ncbi:MAG: FAD-dependent oxidoreductase [Vallitaleaceae bacterium]|jgi:NADH-quinone oxidoreductase subunit F|nr:FAD-dependent oxidoreductase [Vallitaleaceae bacterium]
MRIDNLNQLNAIKQKVKDKQQAYQNIIHVCYGAGCVSSNCEAIKNELVTTLEKYNYSDKVQINETGCIGACFLGPSLLIQPGNIYYVTLQPEDIDRIVFEHIVNNIVIEELCYFDEDKKRYIKSMNDIPFFKNQERVVLKNCGVMDYGSMEQYISNDGYYALLKTVQEKSPEETINRIKRSGLRGRGGGGFPTGLKWELARRSVSDEKFVICNADEGDPGAFMDRSLLEGDPHTIIEGMAIAGHAIGSSKGYVYVRAEYPLAIERLEEAIKNARAVELLSDNIFGSGFSFDIEVRIGAGAFVCGEETALINSIEGKRGEPRQKPPFPSDSGLFGKPSIINNVETFGNIASIIRHGATWFNHYGTEKSSGTKVFALAGAIKHSGIVEVPMGTPLGDIVFDIGGGIRNSRSFKVAQTGGPSGGCITTVDLNVPVDYESLKELGAIMGSGGLICMDEDNCMVDVAKYFMEFVQDESCGKCVPCRLGTKRMLEILERITMGEGKVGDIENLIELGETIKKTALCGLGQTAPNPVLSTIKYFREEYEAHIIDKKCEAGVCRELVISPCQNACPAGVNVPGYIRLIAAGRERDAYDLIRRENPFPAVCGRVCTHPCESKCRRGTLDDALAVMDLKRYVADQAMKNAGPTRQLLFPSKGKSVAIIGAGPSGLTCGYYLSMTGYEVDVYESNTVAGGMLATGIPEYRLPNQLLAREIELSKQAGMKLHLSTEVGKDIMFEDIRASHDAIYIATGTQFPNEMGIAGENLEGVYYGIDFLKDVNMGKEVKVGKKVAVIGGGSTAMDAARVALRLGAKEVHILYRRNINDMPADKREIEEAREEGIIITTMINPVEIKGDGKVEKLRCILLEPGKFDKSGRRSPVTMKINEPYVELVFDMVITAVSQHSDLPFIGEDEIVMTRWGTFVTDKDHRMLNHEGIFAGGDVVRGPDTVIWAITDGKASAKSIDLYLNGDGKLNQGMDIDIPVLHQDGDVAEHERFKTTHIPVANRINNFAEVNQGFHRLNAIAESMRCLHCDRR